MSDSVLTHAELPPMLVDDTFSATTTTGDHEPNDALPGELAKMGQQMEQQRKRNQVWQQRKHQASLLEAHPPKPGCDFACQSPNCKRRLNRFGLLDHM
jgi:hypothetical protein